MMYLRMNNRCIVYMPKNIDDGRLDGILEIISLIKEGNDVELSFEKTQEITAAGHAILFIILDVACEQKIKLKFTNLKAELQIHNKLVEASQLNQPLLGFYRIEDLNIRSLNLLVYGKSASIAPEFVQMIDRTFKGILNEDRLWDVALIFNVLMQNTAEPYFLYGGVTRKNFEFGILDMGVSIPAKLETKYLCSNDEEYLEKAFHQGVGTRRNRSGGMGLYYLFENVKDAKGRLVVLSRNAQLRKNFGTRNYLSSPLKKKLIGAWCMANIPLE